MSSQQSNSSSYNDVVTVGQKLSLPTGKNLVSSVNRTLVPSKGAIAYDEITNRLHVGNTQQWVPITSTSAPQSHTLIGNWTGAITVPGTIRLQKVGDAATIMITEALQINCNGLQYAVFDTAFPVDFRPQAMVGGMIPVQNGFAGNNSVFIGAFTLSPAGILTVGTGAGSLTNPPGLRPMLTFTFNNDGVSTAGISDCTITARLVGTTP